MRFNSVAIATSDITRSTTSSSNSKTYRFVFYSNSNRVPLISNGDCKVTRFFTKNSDNLNLIFRDCKGVPYPYSYKTITFIIIYMSLKSEDLKTNNTKKDALRKIVSLILERIDDEIKTAHSKDCSYVSVTLPITFSIPHISNKNAQTYIYGYVLKSLLARKYLVDIYLANDQTVFRIKWISYEEETEINQLKELLAKHTSKITDGNIALNKKQDN